MEGLAAPAQRALKAANIDRIETLSNWSLYDLSKLHGIGKNALDKLQTRMLEAGLQFKSPSQVEKLPEKKAEQKTQSSPTNTDLINEILNFMLSLSSELEMQVRWNSPALVYTGKIKEFDPKEYKRDVVVFHLRNPKKIQLIFIHGARLENRVKGLEGNHADGRRMVSISNQEDWTNKKAIIQAAILHWLETVEGK